MSHCIMVTAIGKNAWVSSAISYAWPVIKKYFEDNGHNVYLIQNTPFDSEVLHPSWLWLKCHEILLGYDYILTWNLDILPVKFEDDIFKYLDQTMVGAVMEDPSVHGIFPHFKYNCGMVGVPKSYSGFFSDVYQKWNKNPNSWPSYEQYYVNQEIGERNIPIYSIPQKYAWFFNSPNYKEATCWHYTSTVQKDGIENLFKQHYEGVFHGRLF
jgi:hypothetical protein